MSHHHRRRWRSTSLPAAIAAGLLLASVQIAAAAPTPTGTATATADAAPAAPAAESTTVHLKIGVEQKSLNELRAAGQRSASPAVRPKVAEPKVVQPPKRNAPASALPAAAPDRLTLLGAEESSRRTAAAYAPPYTAPATGAARAAAPTGGERPAPRAAPTPAGPVAPAVIGDQPDGAQVGECLAAPGAESGIGRVHNRFTYCRRIGVVADYWSVDARGVPVEHEGTTTAKLELFAQGDNQQRRARIFARIQKDSVDYDWGPWDNLFTAPDVPLSLMGQCVQDSDVCHATPGPATMPWIVWDNNSDWFSWDVYNHDPEAQGRDKISYNQWLVELFTDDGDYHTLIPGRTPPRMLRCDSAAYFNLGRAQYPNACVFNEVTPRLNYQLASDYRSVAFHIYTAQYHPDDTYPLLVPRGVPAPRSKRIPGRYEPDNAGAPGLHRITQTLHPGDTQANAENKDGACYKKGPVRDEYLDTGLPQPPAAGEQCDEYPFASTLEGAGHPYWDFSVKPVPQRDNSIAGGLLRTYYVNDRILAWDPGLPHPDVTNDRFYVAIQ